MNSRQREQRRHELKVGLTILISIVILIVAIFSVGEQRGLLQERYKLRILMSQVNGLQTGAPVWLAGVRVGTVTKVEFSGDLYDQKIEVELEIDNKVRKRITKDSHAHIGTLGLLGDKYVGITLGSPSLEPLKDMDLLESSDPMDVERLLGDGAEIFGDLKKTVSTLHQIVEKVNRGKGTLGMLINDPRIYFDLDRLLVLTESLTQKVEGGEGTLAKLFSDSTFYYNLNELVARSSALADSLNRGGGTAARLIHDPKLFEEMVLAAERLNQLTQKITSGEGTIGKALVDQKLYNNMARVTSEMDSLIQDIRRNPQKYLKIEIF